MRIFSVILPGLFLTALLLVNAGFSATIPQTDRTDSGGGVTVKVTPVPSKGTGDLRFQIALDTHSVNLDGYDLKAISLLRDDAGNTYLPTGIENKGSGHHRESTVTFVNITSAKRLELVIKDLAGIKERIFRWDLIN